MCFKIVLKNIHVLILLIILYNAQSQSQTNTGTSYSKVDPKIIGGVPVEEDQAKFMVSIHVRIKDYLCGGSLISDTKILTAAHCFFNSEDKRNIVPLEPSIYYVTMGSIYLFNTNSKALSFNISSYVYHKYFNTTWLRYDIGLVIFKGLNLSKYPNIEIIKLTDRRVKPGENCIVYGWGRTERTSFSTILRQVNLSVIDYEICARSYSRKLILVFPNELCAGIWTGGKGSCTGDSGGPLVSDGKLVGIVSRGYNCALAKFPTIYEDVFEYKYWIEHGYKHLGKYGNSEIIKINYCLVIYIIFLWIIV